MKLLWMYDDLLDLYGDRGNIMMLCSRLKECGYEPELERKSIGDDIDFSEYRFVYIGPGLISNTIAALQDIHKRRAEIQAAIDGGTVFLVVGSAQILFCHELQSVSGDAYQGLGLFDVDLIEENTITAADIVCTCPEVPSGIYGFINNTVTISYRNEPHWFDVTYRGQGCKLDDHIGLRRNNFFSTWLLGPLLVRNPDLMNYMLTVITGHPPMVDDRLERVAYTTLMRELGQ